MMVLLVLVLAGGLGVADGGGDAEVVAAANEAWRRGLIVLGEMGEMGERRARGGLGVVRRDGLRRGSCMAGRQIS